MSEYDEAKSADAAQSPFEAQPPANAHEETRSTPAGPLKHLPGLLFLVVLQVLVAALYAAGENISSPLEWALRLEVELIALVLFAIGALGVVDMALRGSRSSFSQSHVTGLIAWLLIAMLGLLSIQAASGGALWIALALAGGLIALALLRRGVGPPDAEA